MHLVCWLQIVVSRLLCQTPLQIQEYLGCRYRKLIQLIVQSLLSDCLKFTIYHINTNVLLAGWPKTPVDPPKVVEGVPNGFLKIIQNACQCGQLDVRLIGGLLLLVWIVWIVSSSPKRNYNDWINIPYMLQDRPTHRGRTARRVVSPWNKKYPQNIAKANYNFITSYFTAEP